MLMYRCQQLTFTSLSLVVCSTCPVDHVLEFDHIERIAEFDRRNRKLEGIVYWYMYVLLLGSY